MKAANDNLSEKNLAFLVFLGTMIIGAWLRMIPAASVNFPINDGGMFFTMIRDLQKNGFALPAFTTYNNLSIPFSYPPLSFYFAGLLNYYLKLDLLSFLTWFPAIINIFTLPAFLYLAKIILKSDIKASIAAFLYALTPLSMDWFLMGGGLTRSLGQLFLILACIFYFKLFEKHSPAVLFLAVVFSALLILTHPESAILAVCSGICIWFFSSRNKSTVIDAAIIVFGTVILVSPWLILVISRTGLTPFLNAFQTNGSSLLLWRALFTFDFAQEKGLPFLSVTGLLGIFYLLSQRKYFLPIWMALPFFINPRSAARLAIIPLAMIAAIFTMEIIIPGLFSIKIPKKKSSRLPLILIAVYISGYMIINSYSLASDMSREIVSKNELAAFSWIQRSTPINSTFIVLTGKPNFMRDPVQEWFPALTGRTSLTTMQGREWTWGTKFMSSLIEYQGLHKCISEYAACIKEQTSKLGLNFDYLYVSKPLPADCSTGIDCQASSILVNDLNNSQEYSMIFENQSSIIFQKLK
ncbi:MAG: hypothetical protein WCP19_13305 [Chloroflexota bacterium]